MRTKRDEKRNEALVVVVEPSIDQKISNTGHRFNRIFSIKSILNIPISKKNGANDIIQIEIMINKNHESLFL